MRFLVLSCLLAVLAVDGRLARGEGPAEGAGPTTAPAAPDQSANDKAKNDDVRKLLRVSGTAKMGEQAAKQMLQSMQRLMPSVPQKFWDDCAKEMTGDSLIELEVPIYAKHFTDDEVKQLISFYESPIGQRLVAEQPGIMQESMQAGQQWGREIGERVAQKLKDQGYQKS